MANVTLNNLKGNLDGKNIYSVIFITEGDLAECSVDFYCGDSYEEISTILEKEEYNLYNVVINECGLKI